MVLPQSRAEQQHLRFLDGLRAIAALVVISHHAWLQSWPYTLYHGPKPSGVVGALTGWLAFGKLAVTAFIVISGFCLMLPVVKYGNKIDAIQFFLRRCRRILPPYYAALVLALLLDVFVLKRNTGTIYDGSFPVTLSGVLSHFLLVQNFTTSPYQIAGPFWSIAVEFQIYLLFPLLVWIYRGRGIWTTLATTTILGYSSSLLFTRLGMTNTYSHYIAMFGIGMAAAHFAFSLKESALAAARRICYGVFPVLIVIGAGVHRQLGSNKLITDTLLGILVGCVLFLATVAPGEILSRSLSLRPLVWMGSFSYSLYLVHFPMQQLLWQWIAHPAGWSRNVTFFSVATLGTAVILGVGFGFFELFEKPFLTKSADGRRRAALAETTVA
jgi:peptidoglycan/LPS O-acetylase OafA/YrhL